MHKPRNLVFIAMLLFLVSACGASENKKPSQSTPPANINAGVKRVEEQIARKQEIEQTVGEEKVKAETETPANSSAATGTKSVAETKTDTQPTPELTSIYTIVMLNKYGQVAFNHAAHTQFISCGTCHPTEPPTRIDKNRKEFHALCRTCHQESGAGPIKCSGCHEH